MFLDVPRTIYLISPQPWDGFNVSKHHYARALAKMGHRVFFIEAEPTTCCWGRIEIGDSEIANLKIVRYAGNFFRWLRFRARCLYDALGALKVGQLIRHIGMAPDIVWDFDNHFQFHSLALFESAVTIFHPVDALLPGWSAAKEQDLHIALSKRFTEGVDPGTPVLFVPHGLNPTHSAYAKKVIAAPERFRASAGRPTVGYVGNLAMRGIDWPMIKRLVTENPDVMFQFIGPTDGLHDCRDREIIARIAQASNCEMAGVLPAAKILKRAKEVDIWLVCYDIGLSPNLAINSHKILEYLATGKAVISNYVAAYESTGLLYMPIAHSNDELPEILARILADTARANDTESMVRRARFALDHDYGVNLDLINRFLTEWEARRAMNARSSGGAMTDTGGAE